MAARSDPRGLTIFYEASSPQIVTGMTVDLQGSGQWSMTFPGGTDGRAVRGLTVKPVLEGIYTLTVTATDAQGCVASAVSSTPVTVVR